ncbi:hypothetical protein [Rickettsia tamurae]|uniref:hypothetical protein n=1 Tax=Rickettsia tamurae TaxID=334545 RepID=UPI00050A2465|nr:hypothetical protein [Rickettsia tamurae]
MFSYLFSKNTVSNNISPEKVVNNSTTYAGVKVSEATFEYFANAKAAAVGCTTSAATAVGYGYKVLGSAFMGACAYEKW